MVQKITGEAPFQVLATNFSISPSQQDYTLQISADGTNYSDLFTVSAGQTKMVTNVANGSYYRMKNNASEVSINWRTQCNDGQGGGGGSYILPPATQQTLGGIKVGSGLTVQADGTLSANGGADPEAIQELIDANNTLIEEGEIIAGMAKQLYSPDGVTSEGAFIYRTTAGDEDVSTGDAELRVLKGNSDYSEVSSEYDASASLQRGGEEVTGFTYEITTGDVGSWQSVPASTADTFALQCVSARAKITSVTGGGWGRVSFAIRQYYGPNNMATVTFNYATTGYTEYSSKCTQVDSTHWILNDTFTGAEGTVEFDGEWLVFRITNTDTYRIYLYNCYVTGQYTSTVVEGEAQIGSVAENDLNFGETTYTYDGSDWSETLPQAITSMSINGVDYVPQSGDELVVTLSVIKTGNMSYPAPESFVALGLNSFTKGGSPINFIAAEDRRIGGVSIEENDYGLYQDNDYDIYAIKAVTGLENGYIVYHKSGSSVSVAGVADKDIENLDISYSATVHTSTYDVVYPTVDYPYIVFSLRKDDEGTVCVHPRWSGYMDENYEDYTESVLDISSFNTDCPLLSVGNVRNIWDFENSKLIQNIGVSTYSAQAVIDLFNDGKEIGVDFDFDENNIYEVLDEPIVTDITFENEYEANDFSVEYFTQDNDLISTPVYVTTWYMNNLVDKLRRLNGVVHLDNLNGVGDEDTLYEADEMLWTWSDSDGVVAEWTDSLATLGNAKGYGLIFSHIPEGQVILEFQNSWASSWRKIKMINGVLTLTDGNDSVITSCTIGNKAQFNSPDYTFYWIKVNYQKHWIGFEVSSSINFQNIWDGTVQGGHFVITDHSNHPWMDINSDYGIPVWDDKGWVLHKQYSVNIRTVKVNRTTYQTTDILMASGQNNFPDSIYVPTVGGTAGQILQSNGTESAPTWTNWIKVVKITSDDYDALVQAGTTDPNTLYAIVDE